MCFLGLIHATLVILTYHAGGDTNPILGIFVSTPVTGPFAEVPFQPFGFFALVILVLMAATSHDFWLANLSAPVWKSLHMLVYAAYGLLVLHVTFGILQSEVSPVYVVTVALGFVTVLGLHLMAGLREIPADRSVAKTRPSQIPRTVLFTCAPLLRFPKKEHASFVSAANGSLFSNTTGRSPPYRTCASTRMDLWAKARSSTVASLVPGMATNICLRPAPRPHLSSRKVPTFNVRLENGRVMIHPKPNPPGIRAEPVVIGSIAEKLPGAKRLSPGRKQA